MASPLDQRFHYTAHAPGAPAASAPPYDYPPQQPSDAYLYPTSSVMAPPAAAHEQHPYQYNKPGHDSTPPDAKAQDHLTLDVQFQDDVSLLNRGVPGFSDQSIKKGFIRKVYGILTVQVLFTFAMCAVFMLVQPVQNWTIRNTWIMWVALVLSIVIMFPMFHWKKEYPRNMICLALFTVFQSYTVALVCGIYAAQGNADTVLLAWGLTGVIFLSLTVFTFQSKIDFSFLGGFLSCGLIIIILWGISMSILGWRTSFLYSLFGALLFCGYILYDTSNIINRMGPDDYVPAAIELYLDIINLFLFLLRLLGRK